MSLLRGDAVVHAVVHAQTDVVLYLILVPVL